MAKVVRLIVATALCFLGSNLTSEYVPIQWHYYVAYIMGATAVYIMSFIKDDPLK